MPLHVSRDSFESKQVTLADMVEMCRDCTKYCLEKTERLLSNRSHAPRGWEKEYELIASERRKEDADLCVAACTALPRSCPSVSQLRAVERGEQAAPQKRQSSSGGFFGRARKDENVATPQAEVPTTQELVRCENAAERFSKVLFAIAQKPSKIHFDNVNPKTGEKVAEELESTGADSVATTIASIKQSGGADASGRKPLDKKTANDEILKRWSTSRRERTNMEELGVLRTEKETQGLKEDMMRKEAQEHQKKLRDAAAQDQPREGSGTVPRW